MGYLAGACQSSINKNKPNLTAIFRVTFKRIKNAMWKFDPFIYESQNAGWEGMVKYYESNEQCIVDGGLGCEWGSGVTL